MTAAGARYDFALAAGSTGDDAGQAIATDAAGNVLRRPASSTARSISIPARASTTSPAPAAADVFVAKYSSTGALRLGPQHGRQRRRLRQRHRLGTRRQRLRHRQLHRHGRLPLRRRAATTSPPRGSPGAGTQDAFVAKLDSSGRLVWADDMGGTGDDVANAIAVAADGSVYTTGYFQGTADFDRQRNRP